jgi:hypothetical protein
VLLLQLNELKKEKRKKKKRNNIDGRWELLELRLGSQKPHQFIILSIYQFRQWQEFATLQVNEPRAEIIDHTL